MPFLNSVTQDDVTGFRVLEPGVYAVELSELTHNVNAERGTEYLSATFTVLAALEDDKWIPVANSPTVTNYFTFIKRDGSPNEVASRIYATMIYALTRESSVDTIKKEYDADTLEELAEKASILVTLRCRAWIGVRDIVSEDGTKIKRNTISGFRALTDEDENKLNEVLGADVVPF